MRKGILFGFGSEIGCKLVELSLKSEKIIIENIINTPHGSVEENLRALKARLIISNPNLVNTIELNVQDSSLIISNSVIKCIFISLDDYVKKAVDHKNPYDFGILATNKIDIGNADLIDKLRLSCKVLFGVAESNSHNSIYYPLLKIDSKRINSKKFKPGDCNYYAVGSCQSIGWTSTTSFFVSWLDDIDITSDADIISSQVDIVHPDTPQGRFGTKSYTPREQDARNNFRPSFSQVTTSMNRVLNHSINISPVSLRTCIEPPGYQISRYLISVLKSSKVNEYIKYNNIHKFLIKYSHENQSIINFSDEPYGSKAFSLLKTASTILSSY